MNYELFYSDVQVVAKEVKDKTDVCSKTVKKIQKCLMDGDINALPKLFATMKASSRESDEALIRLKEMVDSFSGYDYMANGDFAAQLLECCERLGVDVQGDFPVYEMFPCKVTINPDTQDVTIDKKKLSCMRPTKVVGNIKNVLDKLSKASFNVAIFAKELATAYDLALIKASKKKALPVDAPLYLSDLYDYLTPMRRHKKEYTKLDYAYDLARLFSEESLILDDGRAVRFDTVRDSKKAIRILDRHGAEQYITTIRFYK